MANSSQEGAEEGPPGIGGPTRDTSGPNNSASDKLHITGRIHHVDDRRLCVYCITRKPSPRPQGRPVPPPANDSALWVLLRPPVRHITLLPTMAAPAVLQCRHRRSIPSSAAIAMSSCHFPPRHQTRSVGGELSLACRARSSNVDVNTTPAHRVVIGARPSGK